MKNIIAAIIVAGAIVGIGFYAITTFLALKAKEMDNEARYQCAMSSRYETKDPSGAMVSYPTAELYTKCLQEKGIK